MEPIDKLAWIHIVDRRILSTRSKGKGIWFIPGGKREAGESDHQALAREIREELSVELSGETMSFVGVFENQAAGHPAGVSVRMTCYKGCYEGALQPSSEIEEMAWLTHADKSISSPVDGLIFDWLKERNLID